jgi:hypothetical protein
MLILLEDLFYLFSITITSRPTATRTLAQIAIDEVPEGRSHFGCQSIEIFKIMFVNDNSELIFSLDIIFSAFAETCRSDLQAAADIESEPGGSSHPDFLGPK